MAAWTGPVGALQQLFNLDRRLAVPLVAGMAVMAAAAIVKSYGVETGTMILVGSYVVGLGLLLVIVAAIVQTEWLKQLLGAAVALLLLAVVIGFAFDVFVRPAWMPPPWCVARFWLPCPVVEREILLAHGGEITTKTEVPAKIAAPPAPVPAPTAAPTAGPAAGPTPAAPTAARVYIQFAGLVTRDSVEALAAALRKGGWRVQGDSGERTEIAAGLNEVRYGQPADRAAAEALAQAVTATGITSRPVVAKRLAIVGGNLELWMSN